MLDATERKREQEHSRTYIQFLECLDRVNRVIHQSDDVDQMLREVLETVFPTFGCDRIWLCYPCDPESHIYRIRGLYVPQNRSGYR